MDGQRERVKHEPTCRSNRARREARTQNLVPGRITRLGGLPANVLESAALFRLRETWRVQASGAEGGIGSVLGEYATEHRVTEEISQGLQRIIDECGYIVIAHHSQHPIGACLEKVVDGHGIPYGFPLVVIGYATEADYLGQVEKYSKGRPQSHDYCFEYFHKVTAE